jgi:hypothetical protein
MVLTSLLTAMTANRYKPFLPPPGQFTLGDRHGG